MTGLVPAIRVIASEAKQSSAEAPHWIASSRSRSSGRTRWLLAMTRSPGQAGDDDGESVELTRRIKNGGDADDDQPQGVSGRRWRGGVDRRQERHGDMGRGLSKSGYSP